MCPDNDTIGSKEVLVLVVSVALGSGIVGLPSRLAREAGPDAWLSVLVAWAVSLLGGLIIVHIMQRYPRQSIVRITESLGGKVLAKIVGIVYSTYFLLVVCMSLRTAADHINIALLPRTPIEFIMLGFLLVAVYITREGIEPISRFMTILFPFLLIPLILTAVALRTANFDGLLPILADGTGPVVKGGTSALIAFLGFEGLLVWTVAVRRPEKVKGAVLHGINLVGFVTLAVVVITTLVFTRDQASSLVIALKSIVDTVDLPRTIIGHFDVVLFAIWISASLSVFIIALYGLSRFLQDTCGFRSPTPLVLPLVPVVYLSSLLPANLSTIGELIPVLALVGLFLAVIFPLLVLLWTVVRDKLKSSR